MKACTCRWVMFLILSVAQNLVADDAPRSHSVTIDDYFTQSIVSSAVISPDGSKVAYVERRWQGPTDPSNADLWIVDCTSHEVQRLTFDVAADERPAWSPDGRWIYFTSKRKRDSEKQPPWNDTMQIWRVDLSTGREMPVTSISDGIDAFRLSASGKHLYYSRSRKQFIDDWKTLREEFADLKYGHGVHKVSEIWRLDLTTWRADKVHEPKRFIHSFSVTEDESRIGLITTPDDVIINFEGLSRVDVLDVKSQKVTSVPDELWRKQGPSPYGWIIEPTWSPNGTRLAFLVQYDGYPSETYVATVREDSIGIRKLPRMPLAYINGGLVWRRDELLAIGDQQATRAIFSIKEIDSNKPDVRQLTHGDVAVDSVSVSKSGEWTAMIQAGTTHSRDVFLAKSGQEDDRTRLTNLNPQIDTWKLPKVERFQWKAADGVDVEGLLELPADAPTGQPLATIVNIHGGPTGMDNIAFQFSTYGRTVLATRGYAVFYPNYRGSTGYGDKFLTDLIGRENDIEVDDILRGIDALVAAKISDPNRLGVMGWSNGGYLTNCLITKTNRFKAASSGAGVFDMTIQWGEEDTPGHVINYQKGLPWKEGAIYQKTSPLYQLTDAFKTATLIHCGEEDPRVPVTHSKTLHRAIHKYFENVPVELVMYPKAGHSLTEYKHRLAKMKWDQAWFEKHIPVK